MGKKYDLFFLLLSLTAMLFLFVFALPVIARVIVILALSFIGLIFWIIGMVKNRKITVEGGIGLVLFLLDILIVVWGIQSIIASDNFNYAKKLIEVNVPRTAQLLEKVEDHGGAGGDGQSYLVFRLNDTDLAQVKTEILKNKDWAKLPLQGVALYKSDLYTKNGAYGSNRSRDIPINTSNGFYYFTANKDANYANFTFSLLDFDNKILYILRVDT